MRIAIAGAGNVGRAIARELLENGHQVLLIEKNTNARVAFVTRLGEAVLPDEHTVLQEGDLVHLLVNEKQVAETEKTLAKSPAGA